ncbi:hypothetical protein D3C80_2106950 [compost metagenome]
MILLSTILTELIPLWRGWIGAVFVLYLKRWAMIVRLLASFMINGHHRLNSDLRRKHEITSSSIHHLFYAHSGSVQQREQ